MWFYIKHLVIYLTYLFQLQNFDKSVVCSLKQLFFLPIFWLSTDMQIGR